MIPFSLVVAIDQNRGIGKDNNLPWHLPGELKHFREITVHTQNPDKKNVVVMGRKTWESLPERFRPLPNRINIVLSMNSQLSLPDGSIRVANFKLLFELLDQPEWKVKFESIFVIGGASIYEQAIKLPNCQKLYITHVQSSFNCDAFFPPYNEDFSKVKESSHRLESDLEYFFAEYQRNNA